jgi:hypothetical protein
MSLNPRPSIYQESQYFKVRELVVLNDNAIMFFKIKEQVLAYDPPQSYLGEITL